MCSRIILSILALTACLQVSSPQVVYLWGSNETYNELCPPGALFTTSALPPRMCDQRSYVMCSNGTAIALNKCATNERYNNVTTWCDSIDNVPLHEECKHLQNERKYPLSCEEQGAVYVPVNNTCKKYTWCGIGGLEFTMSCPLLSYFIPEEERCMYITGEYLKRISPVSFIKCHKMDPYTLEEIKKGK
ncbi:uncharacterized protein LOC131953446 [Physella acuta]|uniref:uncharacterized protein LOC131953446 n=1 Tax=Physella acuta TaxID=109671 RepID=UPI0027DE53B2|nr:uncharacterized protein LOC131953446 [Physella acuta]